MTISSLLMTLILTLDDRIKPYRYEKSSLKLSNQEKFLFLNHISRDFYGA